MSLHESRMHSFPIASLHLTVVFVRCFQCGRCRATTHNTRRDRIALSTLLFLTVWHDGWASVESHHSRVRHKDLYPQCPGCYARYGMGTR